MRARFSVLPSNPSSLGFGLAINRVEPGQETSFGANCHSLTSVGLYLCIRRAALLLATCLSRLPPTNPFVSDVQPLPELTTHRTHASPNRLEVRRHPSPSTPRGLPSSPNSNLRGPLRENHSVRRTWPSTCCPPTRSNTRPPAPRLQTPTVFSAPIVASTTFSSHQAAKLQGNFSIPQPSWVSPLYRGCLYSAIVITIPPLPPPSVQT